MDNKKIQLAIKFNKQDKLYPELVEELIRQRFTISMVESIINNYLDEPNDKHTKEFQDLQAYRKECKATAKTILKMD